MLTAFILAAALSHLPAPMQGDFDFDEKPDVAEFVPLANRLAGVTWSHLAFSKA
jgi:hypothetical protein